METVLAVVVIGLGAAAIVWGAELFAEHLAAASARLGVTSFALALLLAGAEPEELATAVTASLRDAPGVGFGDVIGANVTICLVALGAAALIAVVPFGPTVRRYAIGGLAVAVLSGALAWDGTVDRLDGAILVALYVGFVAAIWIVERRPPSLGETEELSEAIRAERQSPQRTRRIGREFVLSLAGIVMLGAGSIAIVDAVVRLADVEETQTALGLTLVGFATAAELVVLAWSTARRGIADTVVAAVVGSYAYNVTLTLGAAGLARPLRLGDPALIRGPWIAMLAALALAVVVAWPAGHLRRPHGLVLVALYPLFVAAVVI